MKSSITTKETIQKYYDGIKQKDGWQSLISDEMIFGGGGRTLTGKDAYVEVTDKFLLVVKTSKVKDIIIEGDRACALVSYEIQSPKGNTTSMDVAEILLVKDDKIKSNTIFFDTAAFRNFMAQ